MKWILFLAYSFLVLIFGLIPAKSIKNNNDYFLASRSLSWRSLTFTLVASWYGASSIFVSISEAYWKGLSSLWIIGVPAFLTLLIFSFFSRRIYNSEVNSIPEIFRKKNYKFSQVITSAIIFWYLIVLSSSQLIALGQVIGGFLSIKYELSLLLGLLIILFYSTGGGLKSVVTTDKIQFFIIVGVILSVFIFLSEKNFNFFSSEEIMKLMNPFDSITENLLITLSFTLAWLISPIVWQRIKSGRNNYEVKKSLILSALILFFLYLISIGIGILSHPFNFDKKEGELFILLINKKLGIILGSLGFLAVVSAIMSTLDTTLNTSSMTFTWDVYGYFRKNLRGGLLKISRITLIGSGLLTFLIAYRMDGILKTLGFSSEIIACGFFIPLVYVFFSKRNSPNAVSLSMILGLIIPVWHFIQAFKLIPELFPAWPLSVPVGISMSFVGLILGIILDYFLTKKTLSLKE
ncbi:MAG: sodium:solute symporter family protein [Acidobacteriota bacterium]